MTEAEARAEEFAAGRRSYKRPNNLVFLPGPRLRPLKKPRGFRGFLFFPLWGKRVVSSGSVPA